MTNTSINKGGGGMKKLVDNCEHHSYIIIEPQHKITTSLGYVMIKETYACDDCGKGLDVYYPEGKQP